MVALFIAQPGLRAVAAHAGSRNPAKVDERAHCNACNACNAGSGNTLKLIRRAHLRMPLTFPLRIPFRGSSKGFFEDSFEGASEFRV